MTTTLREIVEAGAGCGKTYGLVARYIRGLGHDPESGAPLPRVRALAPREITSLTFTEDAANEMKERVVRRLGELGLGRLSESVLEESRIGTFHSLCLRLLRPHLKALGYPAGGRIVPEAVSLEARRRHLLRALADDPRRAEILGHLPLRRLAELVRPLWFRVAGQEIGGADPLASAIENYARFREREKARAREALGARPDLAGADTWLEAFLRSLEDPSLADPGIHFNRARKLAQELPELRASAQLWRDLLDMELAPALSAEAAAEERAAHALIDAFFTRLREDGPKLLDYAALEFELHALLTRGGERRLMPPPKLLLVDEFQDTNRTQYAILRALSDEHTEWYFVGDPKQSIYKFRGADVSLFRELCGQIEHRVMDQNWRSDPPTLEFLNRLQEGLFRAERAHDPEAQPLASGRHGRPREALIAPGDARPARAPVRVHVGAPRASFAEALARDFRARAEEFGPAATHAALFTRWKTLHAYAAELGQRGIPHTISGTQPALDHQLTHLLADTLEWIDDPREASAAPLALLRWLSPGDTWSPRALSPDETAALLAQFGPRPREAHWRDLLSRFATLLRPARWPQGAEWTAAMSHALRELESAGQNLELSLPELARFLRRYAGGLDAPTTGAVSNPDGGPARLQLYTVHASKGLQFDCVYLPELKESRGGGLTHLHEDESGAAFRLRLKDDKRAERPSLVFLERERRSQIELEAESRRLFYVATTRTVRSLDLYLHLPSARKASADPLGILGWPARTPFQWNRVLCDLREEGRLSDLERDGWLDWRELEAEVPAEDSPREERWLRPEAPLPARPPERPFFREGVSRYLERETPSPARSGAHGGRAHEADKADRARLGTDIHAVLELWDGRSGSLAPLIGDHPQRATLEAALRGVRALPELTEFWAAAARDDESVRRELGLYIHTENHRLSGFADAVWFRSDGALWILDWKTSGSLRNLARPDRAQKIRRQLALYAESLRPRFSQIHGAAIGIELGETPRAEFLFLEPLHS